jgi:hypothetical protein
MGQMVETMCSRKEIFEHGLGVELLSQLSCRKLEQLILPLNRFEHCHMYDEILKSY